MSKQAEMLALLFLLTPKDFHIVEKLYKDGKLPKEYTEAIEAMLALAED